MLDWINKTFETTNSQIIVETDLNGGYSVCDPNWLATQLNGCSTPPTHDELSKTILASQNWQPVFDQWKEKGIIS